MIFVRKEGTDKKLKCWRAFIEIKEGEIVYKIENFSFGYRDGENFKKVFVSRDNLYVSILSKDREGLNKFEDILIESFRNKILKCIDEHEKNIITETRRLKRKKEILNSTLFRKYKIDDFLD